MTAHLPWSYAGRAVDWWRCDSPAQQLRFILVDLEYVVRWPRLQLLLGVLCGLSILVVALSLQVQSISSSGQGNTIGGLGGLHTTSLTTSLALDGAGHPVVAFVGIPIGLRVGHCDDPGCLGGGDSVTAPDTVGDVGTTPSLQLDSSGFPVVAYRDSTHSKLKLLHCNDADCAGGDESIQTPDTGNDVGFQPSLSLDAAGNPVVAYQDSGNRDLRVLHCNDSLCTGSDDSIQTPDSLGEVGSSPSLALDGSGNPVVLYFDTTTYPTYHLRLLHCNDALCAGGDDSIENVDTLALAANRPSLALDTSGNPVMAYHGDVFEGLAVLRCNDAACSGGDESLSQPDPAGGSYTSLVLDAGGNPVVSHYDGQVGVTELHILHCNDPYCLGGDESTAVPDSAGDAGLFTSAQLDASGNPVVSYSASGYLAVLHCGDPDCSSAKPPTPTPTSAGTATSQPVGGISRDFGASSRALNASAHEAPSYWLLATMSAAAASAVLLAALTAYAHRRRHD